MVCREAVPENLAADRQMALISDRSSGGLAWVKNTALSPDHLPLGEGCTSMDNGHHLGPGPSGQEDENLFLSL